MTSLFRLPLLFSLALAATPVPLRAATHALIVGINDYQGPPALEGAVNDAQDLAAVLRQTGIEPVVLLNEDATREAFIAAFQKLAGAAAPDDLLYVHFSGHGISIADDNGDEDDGRDESYLFQAFDEEKRPDQQIVDDELDALLRSSGREVLFVADACHSGSPTRAVVRQGLPTRLYRPKLTPRRPPPFMPQAAAEGGRIYSVGATFDDRSIPEILIEGKARGALSYTVARALEGNAADLDGDGKVVANEFERFVRQGVRTLAAAKQTPQFNLPDPERLFLTVGEGASASAPPVADAALPVIPVFFFEAPLDMARPEEGIKRLEKYEDAKEAVLFFDFKTEEVYNKVGDVIASNRALDNPRAIIDAARVLEALSALALAHPLEVGFAPDDRIQSEGKEIAFTLPDPPHPYLTIFSLTATGTIHHLWPVTEKEEAPWPEGRAFLLSAKVTPPFGADTLVVLSSSQPPLALRKTLLEADGGTAGALSVFEALRQSMREGKAALGLQSFFTAREAAP